MATTSWYTPMRIDLDAGEGGGVYIFYTYIDGFGAPGLGSGMLTAGGIFVIGATSDRTLRALDAGSGEVLWQHALPVDAMSGVSTYMVDGRQYIVTTAGGHSQLDRASGDYIVAFRLPR